MRLAESVDLTFEEVQLLANCSQPVFVLEISNAAEGLILRGLVRRFPAVVEDSHRLCFLLVSTDQGRLHVKEWIGRHANDTSDSLGHHAATDLIRSAVAY